MSVCVISKMDLSAQFSKILVGVGFASVCYECLRYLQDGFAAPVFEDTRRSRVCVRVGLLPCVMSVCVVLHNSYCKKKWEREHTLNNNKSLDQRNFNTHMPDITCKQKKNTVQFISSAAVVMWFG